MNVLVLYERSGIVRDEFRARGHSAYSCDIEPSESGPQWHHYQFDARDLLGDSGWDLVIAHPPRTHISVSGAHRFAEKRADGRQQAAVDEFMAVTECRAPRLCIENPVGIMSTLWRKPDQIVQPYQFGDDASKKTCLWLRGLPPLVLDPARYVQPRMVDGKPRWANQTDSGQNRLGPSEHRAMDRSRTYRGIAKAMAEQWGELQNGDSPSVVEYIERRVSA